MPRFAPPVGAINGSATLATSSFALSAGNGSYEDVGLGLTLPGPGTYQVTAEVATVVNVSAGANAAIVLKLFNLTDSSTILNSERIGAVAPVINEQYYCSTTLSEIITVAAAKVIKVYGTTAGGTTYSTRSINSDANSRSRMRYVQIA